MKQSPKKDFPSHRIFDAGCRARLSQWLLVTPDEAGKVLEVESKLEKIPAAGIALQLENYYATSKVRAVSLYDFAERLLKGTTANTLPMIKIIETDGEESLRLEKTAVFKEDKLVGYLDQRETRGLLWVLGEVRGGIIVLRLPGAEGKISIEISEAAAKISAAGKEQPVKLEVEIEIEAILASKPRNKTWFPGEDPFLGRVNRRGHRRG